jgi:hypothetical protein
MAGTPQLLWIARSDFFGEGSTNTLPAGPLLKHGLRAQTRRKGKAIKVRRIDIMAGGRHAIEMRLRPANPKWIQHHLRLFGLPQPS